GFAAWNDAMYFPRAVRAILRRSRFPFGLWISPETFAISLGPPSDSVTIFTVWICPCLTECSPEKLILGGDTGTEGAFGDVEVGFETGALSIRTASPEERIPATARIGRYARDEKKM